VHIEPDDRRAGDPAVESPDATPPPALAVSPADAASPVAAAPSPTVAPKITWVHRETHAGPSDVYVDVPRIDFGDAALSSRVDAAVDALVAGEQKSFEAERARFFADEKPPVDMRPLFAASCTVFYASSAIVSVGCEEYAFIAGAHGSKSFHVLDLELPAMTPVRLADLFDPRSHWRRDVRAACVAGVDRELEDGGGADEFLENAPLDAFVVTRSGPRFSFAASLPFVIGSVEPVLLRWRTLDRILRPGGPADAVRSPAPHAEGAPPHGVMDARNDADARALRQAAAPRGR
jgi:hypothetical protein